MRMQRNVRSSHLFMRSACLLSVHVSSCSLIMQGGRRCARCAAERAWRRHAARRTCAALRSPSTATDDVEDALAAPKHSLLAPTATCSEGSCQMRTGPTNRICMREVR